MSIYAVYIGHFILKPRPRDRWCHLHYADEETEAKEVNLSHSRRL